MQTRRSLHYPALAVGEPMPSKKAKKVAGAATSLAGAYIVQPGVAFSCAKSCVKQLESVYVTGTLTTQVGRLQTSAVSNVSGRPDHDQTIVIITPVIDPHLLRC